jgi:SnoaL-like domain
VVVDQSVQLEKVRLMFASPGGDVTHAHEIYHEDAVLEFPQSGERFEGVANFTQWRSQYPAKVSYQLRRVTQHGNLVVSEGTVRYDGGPPMFGVGLHEFRGDKVARERIYGGEPWEAPEWRAGWRSATPADPPGESPWGDGAGSDG